LREIFEAEAKVREIAMAAAAASASHHDEEVVVRTAQPAQVEEIPNKNHTREEDNKQNSPSHRADPAPEV
jgi:K+-transporting ATPase c subunit